MENQISKQAILEYLNERIDVRSNNKYDRGTSYHYSNEAALHAFQSIVTLIEQGVFDEEQYPIGFNHKKEIKLAF
jgi:hypothetical protein